MRAQNDQAYKLPTKRERERERKKRRLPHGEPPARGHKASSLRASAAAVARGEAQVLLLPWSALLTTSVLRI